MLQLFLAQTRRAQSIAALSDIQGALRLLGLRKLATTVASASQAVCPPPTQFLPRYRVAPALSLALRAAIPTASGDSADDVKAAHVRNFVHAVEGTASILAPDLDSAAEAASSAQNSGGGRNRVLPLLSRLAALPDGGRSFLGRLSLFALSRMASLTSDALLAAVTEGTNRAGSRQRSAAVRRAQSAALVSVAHMQRLVVTVLVERQASGAVAGGGLLAAYQWLEAASCIMHKHGELSESLEAAGLSARGVLASDVQRLKARSSGDTAPTAAAAAAEEAFEHGRFTLDIVSALAPAARAVIEQVAASAATKPAASPASAADATIALLEAQAGLSPAAAAATRQAYRGRLEHLTAATRVVDMLVRYHAWQSRSSRTTRGSSQTPLAAPSAGGATSSPGLGVAGGATSSPAVGVTDLPHALCSMVTNDPYLQCLRERADLSVATSAEARPVRRRAPAGDVAIARTSRPHRHQTGRASPPADAGSDAITDAGPASASVTPASPLAAATTGSEPDTQPALGRSRAAVDVPPLARVLYCALVQEQMLHVLQRKAVPASYLERAISALDIAGIAALQELASENAASAKLRRKGHGSPAPLHAPACLQHTLNIAAILDARWRSSVWSPAYKLALRPVIASSVRNLAHLYASEPVAPQWSAPSLTAAGRSPAAASDLKAAAAAKAMATASLSSSSTTSQAGNRLSLDFSLKALRALHRLVQRLASSPACEDHVAGGHALSALISLLPHVHVRILDEWEAAMATLHAAEEVVKEKAAAATSASSSASESVPASPSDAASHSSSTASASPGSTLTMAAVVEQRKREVLRRDAAAAAAVLPVPALLTSPAAAAAAAAAASVDAASARALQLQRQAQLCSDAARDAAFCLASLRWDHLREEPEAKDSSGLRPDSKQLAKALTYLQDVRKRLLLVLAPRNAHWDPAGRSTASGALSTAFTGAGTFKLGESQAGVGFPQRKADQAHGDKEPKRDVASASASVDRVRVHHLCEVLTSRAEAIAQWTLLACSEPTVQEKLSGLALPAVTGFTHAYAELASRLGQPVPPQRLTGQAQPSSAAASDSTARAPSSAEPDEPQRQPHAGRSGSILTINIAGSSDTSVADADADADADAGAGAGAGVSLPEAYGILLVQVRALRLLHGAQLLQAPAMPALMQAGIMRGALGDFVANANGSGPACSVSANPTGDALAASTPESEAESTPESTAESTPESTAESTPESTAESTPEPTSSHSAASGSGSLPVPSKSVLRTDGRVVRKWRPILPLWLYRAVSEAVRTDPATIAFPGFDVGSSSASASLAPASPGAGAIASAGKVAKAGAGAGAAPAPTNVAEESAGSTDRDAAFDAAAAAGKAAPAAWKLPQRSRHVAMLLVERLCAAEGWPAPVRHWAPDWMPPGASVTLAWPEQRAALVFLYAHDALPTPVPHAASLMARLGLANRSGIDTSTSGHAVHTATGIAPAAGAGAVPGSTPSSSAAGSMAPSRPGSGNSQTHPQPQLVSSLVGRPLTFMALPHRPRGACAARTLAEAGFAVAAITLGDCAVVDVAAEHRHPGWRKDKMCRLPPWLVDGLRRARMVHAHQAADHLRLQRPLDTVEQSIRRQLRTSGVADVLARGVTGQKPLPSAAAAAKAVGQMNSPAPSGGLLQ